MKGPRIVGEDDGKGNLKIKCKICGGPITHSNEFGMYCDNECGIEDDKKAYKELKKLLRQFNDLF
jgi:hypothetical protein